MHILSPGQLNTYDVLISDDVVFTESALQAFLAPNPTGRRAKARATSGEVAAVGATASTPAGTAAGTETPGHNTPGEDLEPHVIQSDVPSVVQPEEHS